MGPTYWILFTFPGATELLQIMETRTSTAVPSILKTPSSETALLVLQASHQSHRAPPPDFSDSSGGTLPRPPPPPKTPKPPEVKASSVPPESQPLLPSHGSIQLINTHPGAGGTLTRKGQGKAMDELRVWQNVMCVEERQTELRCLVNDLNRICDELNKSKHSNKSEELFHVWRTIIVNTMSVTNV